MSRFTRRTLSAGIAFAAAATVAAVGGWSGSASAGPSVTSAFSHAEHAHDEGEPATDPRALRGLTHRSGGRCRGAYEVAQTALCSHGPDGRLPGTKADVTSSVLPVSAATAAGTGSPVCEGDGVTGNRTEVLYIRETGAADRYAQYLPSFRSWAAGIDTIYSGSAQQTGGSRHVRFVTDANCAIVVRNVVVPAGATASFGASTNAVKAAGYSRTDRKYVMFVDATVLCGIGGYVLDDSVGQGNYNNRGPSFARVDSGCWTSSAAAHELTHAMGAVFSGAPNATANGHCTDDYDLMCYKDSSTTVLRIVCPDTAQDNLLDCNHNDYFSTNPTPGSWLAGHWNVANSQFLIAGTVTPTPTPTPTPTGPAVTASGAVRSGLAGKCMDINAASSTRGTRVQIWTCNATAAQRWSAYSDNTLHGLGKCLDATGNGTAAGTRVEIWDCTGGGAQVWVAYNGGYRNPQSGRCLEDPASSTTNGTQLRLGDCNGSAAQKWTKPGA